MATLQQPAANRTADLRSTIAATVNRALTPRALHPLTDVDVFDVFGEDDAL